MPNGQNFWGVIPVQGTIDQHLTGRARAPFKRQFLKGSQLSNISIENANFLFKNLSYGSLLKMFPLPLDLNFNLARCDSAEVKRRTGNQNCHAGVSSNARLCSFSNLFWIIFHLIQLKYKMTNKRNSHIQTESG